ncbi:MAG TPA: HDOD domain-containing protein [Solirubrobacterales bacterium]
MSQVATKTRTRKTARRAVKSRAAAPAKADGKRAEAKPQASAERRIGQGGRRLADAFEAVSRMPVLGESRRRLLVACEGGVSAAGEAADAVESDAALTVAVMRAASNGAESEGGGVRQAVETLGPAGLRAVGASLESYDPFDAPTPWADRQERFRRHGVATRHAADQIAELARLAARDELAVAALLHDIGRRVLAELYGEFEVDHRDATPDERIRRERRELGIDHALVGAVLVRRWGMPSSVASAIERHHSPQAQGHAAAVRLADLIVHYASGEPAPPETMVTGAAALGIDPERLAQLAYEFPHSNTPRRRASDPCPLSVREIDALRGLAEGKVYKQIAHELDLSVSTIRTHLHNVYRKIGAVDRAQAVLIARDRGWI